MAQSRKSSKNTVSKNKNDRANTASGATAKDQMVDVLYQKMGSRWYSFTVIDEEVYVGAISDEAIDSIRSRDAKAQT